MLEVVYRKRVQILVFICVGIYLLCNTFICKFDNGGYMIITNITTYLFKIIAVNRDKHGIPDNPS